ncbi:MAG: PmoA family protein [Opitutales bacterium]
MMTHSGIGLRPFAILHFFFILFWVTHSAGAKLRPVQNGDRLTLSINGQLFTEYRSDKHVPCLFPLMSAAGTHLTRQFPFNQNIAGESKDHPHHISFWFAHGQVNGHDFWHGRRGERIVTRSLRVDEVRTIPGGSSVSFTVDLEWLAQEKRILTEERTYTVTETGDERIIEVNVILKATEGDVVFGDTKEGAFGLRVSPTIRLKGEHAKGGISTSTGMRDSKAWGKRAKWVAFHGPDSAGNPMVVAILDHPQNLRHPTWWHARDYGLLSANPFGPKAYGDDNFTHSVPAKLKQGRSLNLRYQLVLQTGLINAPELDKRWTGFSKAQNVGDSK